MRVVRTILLVVFSLLVSFPLWAAEAKLPSPAGFINDYTGVLSAQEKQSLENISEQLKKQTGAELAVAIVKTVEPLDPKLYAVKLFETWKIGQKGKDNGVLILLAMQEKRIEIEVGYGLEGALPDAKAGAILDTYALPSFKQGKFGEGLVQVAGAVSKVVRGEPVETQNIASQKSPDNQFPSLAIIYIIIGIIILGIVFRKGTSIAFGIIGTVIGLQSGLEGAIMGAIFGFIMGFWGLRMMGGGGFGGGSGGGFGGFGGGRSGGGGAGRSW